MIPESTRAKDTRDVGVQVKLSKKPRISKKEKTEHFENNNKGLKYCKKSSCVARRRFKNNAGLITSEISVGSSCICGDKSKCQCSNMRITYQ